MAIDFDRLENRQPIDFKIMLMSDLREYTTKRGLSTIRAKLHRAFPTHDRIIEECCDQRLKEVLQAYY